MTPIAIDRQLIDENGFDGYRVGFVCGISEAIYVHRLSRLKAAPTYAVKTYLTAHYHLDMRKSTADAHHPPTHRRLSISQTLHRGVRFFFH